MRASLHHVLPALILLLLPSAPHAATANESVTEGAWSTLFSRPGVDGQVLALEEFEGKVFVGGEFKGAGGFAAMNAASWDGTFWAPAGTWGDPYINAAWISDFTMYEGDLWAVGTFVGHKGDFSGVLAVWKGIDWDIVAWCEGSGDALAVYDGDLIVGGSFSSFGGVAASCIARWDGASFHALDSGVDGYVNALTVHGGALFVGGSFLHAGGRPAARLARWDQEGWHAFDAVFDRAIGSMVAYAGDVVVAGSFSLAGGSPGNHIARWNGSAWSSLGGGTDGFVSSVAVHGSDVYAVGAFSTAGSAAAARVARWNGTEWFPVGPGIPPESPSEYPQAAAIVDGQLFVGGWFRSAAGVPVFNITRYAEGGWQPLGAGHGMDGSVQAFTEFEGDLIAGGEFREAGSTRAERVARWNGSSWSPMGSGFSAPVKALAVHQGELYAGGEFTYSGLTPVSHIARWNGTAWQAVGDGFDGDVLALATYNGQLVAGGGFRRSGFNDRLYIARWDGTFWRPIGETLDTGMNGGVLALTIFDGDLIAGGAFNEAGGIPATCIARWNGVSWSPLGDGTGDGGDWVHCLLVHEGLLIAAGDITDSWGPGDGIAQWDGAAWAPLGTGIHSWVHALASYDGDVIAGGAIFTAGGLQVSAIARWNGSEWSALGPGLETGDDPQIYDYPDVYALTPFDGALFAGGVFNRAGPTASSGIAAWRDAGPVSTTVAALVASRRGSGASVRWRVPPGSRWVDFVAYREWAGHPRHRCDGSLRIRGSDYEFVDPAPPLGATDYYLLAIHRNGSEEWFGPATLAPSAPPARLSLSAQPNPFGSAAAITFSLPVRALVRVTVHDVQGRLVATLQDGMRDAGTFVATWDGRNAHGDGVASGTYVIKLDALNETRTLKVTLMR